MVTLTLCNLKCQIEVCLYPTEIGFLLVSVPLKTKPLFTSAPDNVNSFKSMLDKEMPMNFTDTYISPRYMFLLKEVNLEATNLLYKDVLL